MSNLPHDLVEEILSRVPATALSRFRSTCKRWDALFKEQRFTKKHFDRAPKQSLALMLNEGESFRVSSLSVNLHGIDNNNDNIDAPIIEFKGELTLNDSSSSEQVYILRVFHCDGLLLCHTKNDRLVVWNPCTGETKWIKSNRYFKYSMFSLGYENNNKSSRRDFKLLWYRDNLETNNPVVEFGIYEFSSGSWRVLNDTTRIITRPSGVSLKGNTYWVTYHNSLLSFDFSTERLGCLRLPFQAEYCDTTALTTVREEQLSVLHNNSYSLKIEIWVTTDDKIDHTVVLSWRKFFAIDQDSLFGGHLLSSCVSFFIDEEKNVVVFCGNGWEGPTIKNKVRVIGEYGVYGEMDIGEHLYKSREAIIFNYVPSLIQIQQEEEH